MREQNCIFARAPLDVDGRCFDDAYAGPGGREEPGDPALLERLALLQLVENFCCRGKRTEGVRHREKFYEVEPAFFDGFECWVGGRTAARPRPGFRERRA